MKHIQDEFVKLNERDADIVKMRFALGEYEHIIKLKVIAEKYGISVGRVSQITRKIESKTSSERKKSCLTEFIECLIGNLFVSDIQFKHKQITFQGKNKRLLLIYWHSD
jgi:hypothetical protein